jgi:hypothetical protein
LLLLMMMMHGAADYLLTVQLLLTAAWEQEIAQCTSRQT